MVTEFKRRIARGSIYGKLMLLIGVLIAVPLILLLFYPQEAYHAPSFMLPSAVLLVSGTAACFVRKRKREAHEWQSALQKGSLPVLFAWFCGIVTGAAPFVISSQLNVTHALFESVSGWTATGLTVADTEALPHIFLFHRSFMQYCGGLGFILMILMLVGGKQATNLFSAEGHSDRLMPNIRSTGHTIFLIYNGFLTAGTLLYVLFGMPLFDAVCHTMSALSTAGFTTQPGNIGAYTSFPIEAVTILLMLIGSTNFAVLLLLTQFKLKKLFRVSEVRFMFVLVAVFTPLIAFSLTHGTGMSTLKSLHQALFSVVTAFTTTGYTTANYTSWPPFAIGLLILLMIIGGSAGSTAGGIKLLRVYFLTKISFANIRKRLSPSRRVTVLHYYRAQGKTPIDSTMIADTLCFVFFYTLVLITGTLLITLTEGCSLFDALFEFASAFGTSGISNGLTGSSAKTGTLIVEMAGMLLGRLEIFIVFIGIQVGISKIRYTAQAALKK